MRKIELTQLAKCAKILLMNYEDKNTKLFIANPDNNPLQGNTVSSNDVYKNLKENYILSASGWRHVFAESGNEEDFTTKISNLDALTVAYIAKTFFLNLKKSSPKILLSLDARPTGPTIGDIFCRVLISMGAKVDYLFISAAPETMAYSNDSYDAFAYITASHNPVGHNGFKFGVNGGVYNKEGSAQLENLLFNVINEEKSEETIKNIVEKADKDDLEMIICSIPENKKKAERYYRQFVIDTANVDDTFKAIAGLVAEFNGSARGISIDKNYLSELGCKVISLNERPTLDIVHAIVPEGKNLEMCRRELERAYLNDKSFSFGYVPDNDGDRGNFVYINKNEEAEIIEAQVVFAIVATIEMASAIKNGKENIAIAVNGPTSARIDAIAKKLGASTFRAEVGEANVVSLGEELRSKGYTVPLTGEGSNGGNITYPAKVRDPLNSVMSILKLLSDKKIQTIITEKLNSPILVNSIPSLIAALPSFTTTGAFEPNAKLYVKHTDYVSLKENYEKLLTIALNEDYKNVLSSFGITSYSVYQTEGTLEKLGMGKENRSGKETGGYKVLFKDTNDDFIAYMWMRPSGTEPVLRVLVDVIGEKKALHDELLHLQRSLITKADELID